MSTKKEVRLAFSDAGIDIDAAEPYNGCAVVFEGERYVAFFASHGGWQIGKSRSPATRTTVNQAQAKAWAIDAVWVEGTPCQNGAEAWARRSGDGVEKGRPVSAAPKEVTPTALVAPAVAAADEKAKAALGLARAGFTPDQVMRLLGA